MKTVKFLKLFESSEQGFLLFLMILDLAVFGALAVMFSLLSGRLKAFMVTSTALFVCGLHLTVTTVSLVYFMIKGRQLSYLLHDFYNWTRMVCTVLILIISAYLLVKVLYLSQTNLNVSNLVIAALTAAILAAAAFAALNINWSVTLKEILNDSKEREEAKNGTPISSDEVDSN